MEKIRAYQSTYGKLFIGPDDCKDRDSESKTNILEPTIDNQESINDPTHNHKIEVQKQNE